MNFTFPKTTVRIAIALAVLTSAELAIAQQASTEQQQATAVQADKYTWLEDIYGDKQLAWVNAENARTAAIGVRAMPCPNDAVA